MTVRAGGRSGVSYQRELAVDEPEAACQCPLQGQLHVRTGVCSQKAGLGKQKAKSKVGGRTGRLSRAGALVRAKSPNAPSPYVVWTHILECVLLGSWG